VVGEKKAGDTVGDRGLVDPVGGGKREADIQTLGGTGKRGVGATGGRGTIR